MGRRALPMLVAALAVAGCAGERIVSMTQTGRGVPLSDISALASSARNVEVHGAPPDGAAPGAVAATLRVPGYRNDRPFAVVPTASPDLRVVLEFGVPTGSLVSCRQPGGVAQSGPLELTATLCRGGSYLSTATMRSDTLRGPGDPEWQGAMDRLMIALLPPEINRIEFR